MNMGSSPFIMQLSGWANALTQLTTFGHGPGNPTNVIDPRGYGGNDNWGMADYR
jgi:hypothetical protein